MTQAYRVRFAQRELLRAADLNAVMGMLERGERLHVRAVHHAAGVALGFAVALSQDASGLVVEPGYGYERRGGELVSGMTVHVPAPAAEGVFVLALRRGVCGIEWHWLEPEAVRDELVLCRCHAAGGQVGEPDTSVRRSARGPSGRLAAGTFDTTLAPVIDVVTKAASFRKTPVYFAAVAELTRAEVGVGLLLDLVAPSRIGFELVVRAAHVPGRQPLADGTPLTVHWLGVEAAELEPTPDLT